MAEVSKAKRYQVFVRDNWHCWYCGEDLTRYQNIFSRLDTSSQISVDHLLPRSKGGGNTLDNLVTACRSCNTAKKDLTLEQYRTTVTATYNNYFRSIQLISTVKNCHLDDLFLQDLTGQLLNYLQSTTSPHRFWGEMKRK